MTIFFVIIGGAAGGVLGWLFDRLTQRGQPEEAADDCQPRT